MKAPAGRDWDIAGGSVTGRTHVRTGRNNQDAFAWSTKAAGTVMVVCDGCSSEPHSEVGARLGASLLVEAIASRLTAECDVGTVIEDARVSTLASLGAIASVMGPSRMGPCSGNTASRDVVYDHFLFTIVGAVVGVEDTIVFALGDGAAWINDARLELGTFEGNAPPYLGYALIDGAPPFDLTFTMLARIETANLRTLAIGTDGVHDLTRGSSPTGGVGAFFTDRVFSNRDMIRRELTRAARDLEHSLPDDTTLIVLRRTATATVASFAAEAMS